MISARRSCGPSPMRTKWDGKQPAAQTMHAPTLDCWNGALYSSESCSASGTKARPCILSLLDRSSEAATWSQRVRDVGAAHGFFSLESTACIGLGMAAIDASRFEEGLALLRNALVAAELNELDDPVFELHALKTLIQALFKTNLIDEVEPLVLRYREATKAERGKEGFCLPEFDSIVCSARLHEVLCLCTPRWSLLYPCLQHGQISSATGLSALDRSHMHLLNLALSAGTWEVSRGREGGARSARSDARERGKSAHICRGIPRNAGASEPEPQHSRSGGWGGGAHQGGGSHTGKIACALALRVR